MLTEISLANAIQFKLPQHSLRLSHVSRAKSLKDINGGEI